MANQPVGLEAWVTDIYADKVLTNTEFQALRDEADMVYEGMSAALPGVPDLPAFQKLADETVQSMQSSILAVKKTKPSEEVKAQVKEGFGFQVAYIKACLDRFTQTL
ncbi:hypothetical protein [Pseudomonas huanghezhanensis]|uniref:hypothetical protein n=1 Tax=Pseudomonas huanghezhanensis TaxID=3002903 RepID=UPI002286B40D|nr:hypothetical protein [Pseudomonas sp. BSw22131]